jgi:hypothetical protein
VINPQKAYSFGNRLKLNPKFFAESPTPKCVGYTLPKMIKNRNSDELFHGHNLDTISKITIRKGLANLTPIHPFIGA